MLKRWIVIMSLITWSSFGFAGEVLRLTVGNIRPSDPHSMEKFKSSIEQMQRSRLQIIQFKGPIQASDRLQLESRGLRVHAYIPDDAYIVEGSPEVLSRFALEPRVNSVLPIPSAWKKSADLPKVSIFNRDQQVALMVQLVDDQADSAFRKALQNFSEVEILAGEGKAYYLRIQLAQLDELIRLDQVIWVQTLAPMKLQYLDIPEYLGDGGNGDFGLTGDYTDLTGYESGTRIMGFEEAWQRGLDGRGQLVAMADTGLDSGEVTTLLLDLRGRVAKGYSFGIGASSWSDPMGHGTHVAGSVASHGAASGGLIRGGAFAAQFIPEGMWSPIIDNLTVPPKLGKLFSAVYSDGARIHTNSWGGGQLPGAYDSFAAQVDEYIWANPDMLILFAAGNNGSDADKNGRIDENSMASPGSAKNVLTVGASENFLNKGGIQRKLGELMGGDAWNVEPLGSDTLSNNANGLAVFSSRGPCRDGRIKPDVVAPGTNILSNCSTVTGANPLWGHYNPDYCYSGGTSMSTPLVAGAAALLRQYLTQEWNLDRPSAALMKALILQSADDLFPGQYGEGQGQEILRPAPNVHEGYGRVNIDRATTPKALDHYWALIDQTDGVATGEVFSQKIPIANAGPVKVTLVYSDAPGASMASRALVNNLDLEVEAPHEPAPRIVSSKSLIDNIEQIKLNDVSVGEITVRVLGTNVPSGRNSKQAFAVVVSR